MKIRKLIRKALFFLLTICLIAGITVIGKGYFIYRQALYETGLPERVENIQQKENYSEYNKLPEVYVEAVVAVEDHRFYAHGGIDIRSIGRALLHDIRMGRFVEGGSTITQQLAKNLYFEQDKDIFRKIAEAFMALDIEKNYTKDQILELYVNCIYFGDGYYCVGDASEGYFQKAPKDMTDYESTLLAGVPNAPSIYAPTKKNGLAEQRQRKVLERMLAYGYFSKEDVEAVSKEITAVVH